MFGTAKETNGQREIKSVHKIDEILAAIKRLTEGTLTEITEEVDLTKGTVHTYLRTLHNCGYLTEEDGVYRLSLQFVTVAEHVRNETSLYMAGHDEIDELAERTGEYVHLVAEERGREVTLYESRGEYAIATDYHLRLRETPQYLHHNAAGKAMLAHFDADRRDRILDAQELEAQTANTITDETELRETLETVRENGYALNDEEEIRGMRAVGVPIRVPDGSIFGAVSMSAPASRLKGERFRSEVPELVMETANLIEVNLETAQRDG
ncbi:MULTISPECIES: IclR family transcriptional regulator [Natrinema]|uniref:IclR family transcriptional regulator n=1 Tax=Natrinema TaxID=88723 RepID=UPI0002B018A4|nr:IclR family transcriptional regulator [Natrinema thermotolerans]ELZ17035.1 Transcriptional regulator IclR [Natrinema thermotolerans DSM 11552]